MNKLQCILKSIILISGASVALILFLCPRVFAVEPKPEPQTPTDIKEYILEQAKAENVSTTIVSWIVSKESQWGLHTIGDDGISLGPWQINVKANADVSAQCAENLTCSTRVSLEWLKQGRQEKWSTWKHRCGWFRDRNPPDCPAG